jgi:hypothetical protein
MRELTMLLLIGAGCGTSHRKVGVAQCDALIERATACAERVGDDFDKALDVWIPQWRKDAKLGEAKRAEIAATCEDMYANLRRNHARCEW